MSGRHRAGSECLERQISAPLTAGAVAGLLDWRFLDLHLHRQARGSLPASCSSILPDYLGDSNHVGGNFEESSEVLDQVISKEVLLSHGRQLEGEEENRGSPDLHRFGASHQDLQHLVVWVEVIASQIGTEFGEVLIWRGERKNFINI